MPEWKAWWILIIPISYSILWSVVNDNENPTIPGQNDPSLLPMVNRAMSWISVVAWLHINECLHRTKIIPFISKCHSLKHITSNKNGFLFPPHQRIDDYKASIKQGPPQGTQIAELVLKSNHFYTTSQCMTLLVLRAHICSENLMVANFRQLCLLVGLMRHDPSIPVLHYIIFHFRKQCCPIKKTLFKITDCQQKPCLICMESNDDLLHISMA